MPGATLRQPDSAAASVAASVASASNASLPMPRFAAIAAAAMAEAGPGTNITVKTARSFRAKIIQSSLRTFGAKLTKPGKPVAAGASPELRAPEEVFEYCNVRQRQVNGIRIYDINPRSLSTRENFIPAQIADLKTEAEPVRAHQTAHSGYALYQIQTHEQESINSHDFAKPQGSKKRKQIYYFAGGGFQNPATEVHWKFLAHLCHELNDVRNVPTTVSLISYPLAPNTSARHSLAALEAMYRSILPQTPPSTPHLAPSTKTPAHPPQHSPLSATPMTPNTAADDGNSPNGADTGLGSPLAPPAAHFPLTETISRLSLRRTTTSYIAPEDDIIFMGDSAGANIALSLTMKILVMDPRSRPPAAVFAISPAVDMRNQHPDMKKLDKTDPILSMNFVNEVASKWCAGEVDPGNPLVSPIQGDVGVFARRKVFVHGVIGGNDILSPDAKLFMQKCQDLGVKGDWLVWEKQMHCFPLAFSYKVLPEANEAVNWILDVLERTEPANGPL